MLLLEEVGVDRKKFGDYIHQAKEQDLMRPNDNYSWGDLIDLAKELLEKIRK